MDILAELTDLQEDNVIEKLQKETLPLVMWGAGSSAPEVSYYLKSKGILISDVFVDDEYYKEGTLFEGVPVLSYTMLKEKYKRVNVIFGNSNYEKKELLKKKECIHHVYCLFSTSYNVFEKTPLSEIEQNIDEFQMVYDILEDDKSRMNLLAFLKTRISGNNQYIIDVFDQEMTFFRNDIFVIDADEVFLDVGAFDGDTIRLFLKENKGRYKKIYAVEPDYDNSKRLKQYIENSKIKEIEISSKGAWNSRGIQYFKSSQEQVSSMVIDRKKENEAGVSGIEVVPLDEMFHYSEAVTLLKINYFEGVKEAVEGAKKILQKQEPKLAITVGFDCRNIRYIPTLVRAINPKYKLYLRYNRGMVSGLTLYGVASDVLS